MNKADVNVSWFSINFFRLLPSKYREGRYGKITKQCKIVMMNSMISKSAKEFERTIPTDPNSGFFVNLPSSARLRIAFA